MRFCASGCGRAIVQRRDEPTLDFGRRRTCGADECRWRGEPAAPRVVGEWPEYMAWKKPFARHDRDPGDRVVVRLPGPEPRLGSGNSTLADNG